MRATQQLTSLLVLALVAAAPLHSNAQGANAGGLATSTAPAATSTTPATTSTTPATTSTTPATTSATPATTTAGGASAGGLASPAATAAGPSSAAAGPLTAQSIAGSISGSSLGTVSTGNVDTSAISVGTVVIPPKTPAKVTVPQVSAASQPAKPATPGGLATCTFNVKGTAVASSTAISTGAAAAPAGNAIITCTGAGAPLDVYGAGSGDASFTSQVTGVNFEPNTFAGPRPVLQFVKANVLIENSIFENLAGVPYTLIFNDSNVQFVNTSFSGNTGTPEGVLHGFGSFFNFTGCNFTANHGRQTGVMTIEDGDAEFTDCIFNGNLGDQANAGAVVVGADSSATFTGTTFVNNKGNAGGAILSYQGTTLTVDRCTFAGNTAANDGGAIQQLGGVIMIGNSTFSQNSAQSIGGAYYGSEVEGSIADSDFSNNTAITGQGGGVYMETVVADIVNCRFYGNSGNAGGALFQDDVEGLINECAFEDNAAANSGGGVSQSGGSGDVTNCIFVNNQAVNLGGGLYQNNRTSAVTSAIFADNVATQAFAGQGAGLFRNGMNGNVSNIFYENNDAALNGGGLYMIASIGDVSDCTFLSNTATTGPAVYAFNCAGQIYNNAFANEPFDAVAIDHSIGFTSTSLETGQISLTTLTGGAAAAPSGAQAAAAEGPDTSGLRRKMLQRASAKDRTSGLQM